MQRFTHPQLTHPQTYVNDALQVYRRKTFFLYNH